MDVQVGDILEMKKPHPCGSRRFLVLRSGMDFKIRCTGCGHEVMVPRVKAEKNIKKIIRQEQDEIKSGFNGAIILEKAVALCLTV